MKCVDMVLFTRAMLFGGKLPNFEGVPADFVLLPPRGDLQLKLMPGAYI